MSSHTTPKVKKNSRNELGLPPLNGIVQVPIAPPSYRPGRRTNVLDELRILLNALLRNPCSNHFRKSLGSNPLDVPNYHMLIQYPMDFDTILRRLNNNYYWQAKEAIEDVMLIFANCRLFSQEGSELRLAGEELRSVFYRYVAWIDLTSEKEVKEARERRPK